MKDLIYDSHGFQDKEALWMKIQNITNKIQNEKKETIKNLYDTYVSRLFNVIELKGDIKQFTVIYY